MNEESSSLNARARKYHNATGSQATRELNTMCIYDANAISEWKKNTISNNAVEAAHDANFITGLRNKMKFNGVAALESK